MEKVVELYLVMYSWSEEKPDNPLAVFKNLEQAKKFLKKQQAIYFPYKRWEIEKCLLKAENIEDGKEVVLLLGQKEKNGVYEIVCAFLTDDEAQRYVKETKEKNNFSYIEYDFIDIQAK